jgi:hypothetical protein
MNQTSGYFSNLGEVTAASIQNVWYNFLQYLPKILGALLILIIGWIVASALGRLSRRAVQTTGIDAVVERAGINNRLNLSRNYHLLSGAVGALVKWLLIIATLIAVAGILDLPQITQFLNQVIAYIPNVVVAVAILTVGLLASDFLANLITKGLAVSQLPVKNKHMLGSVAKYAIMVFAVMAALTQLKIVPELIQILFAGLVLTLALAFGLGGREEAARFFARLRGQQ